LLAAPRRRRGLLDLAARVREGKLVLIAKLLAEWRCEYDLAIVHGVHELGATVDWQGNHDVAHLRIRNI